jgi:hypothetical protein
MPSTLAPDRLGASSRRVLSREARPPCWGEVTLSQELRTVGLLRPHVLVGYRWSHTGLRPGCKSSRNKYIRSFVSQPPQIRTCTCRASGSSSREFATSAIRCRFVDTRSGHGGPGVFPSNDSQDGVPFPPQGPSGWFPWFSGTMRRCDPLPPISPHFVSFVWRYHRGVPHSSPSAQDWSRGSTWSW